MIDRPVLKSGGADTLESPTDPTAVRGASELSGDALRPPKLPRMPGIEGARAILAAADTPCGRHGVMVRAHHGPFMTMHRPGFF